MENRITITIGERAASRIAVGLLSCVLLISALSLVASILYVNDVRGAGMAVKLLGVNEETSLATWWASVALALLATLTAVVGMARASNRAEQLSWWTLAAGFLFLSVDDGVMLHERVGFLLGHGGEFHDARWMVVWLPMAASVGGVVMWRILRMSRPLFLGLAAGSIVFLSGAVGIEIYNASTRYQAIQERKVERAVHVDTGGRALATPERGEYRGRRNLNYVIGTALEELLEMLGVVIWFVIVLRAGIYGMSCKPSPAARVPDS